MRNTRLFLIVQSVVCVLLAVLLIVAVIGIYRSGAAVRAENPLAAIFSGEIAAERFAAVAPLFFAAIGSAAAGLILDAKDENALKPVKGSKVENKAPCKKAGTIRLILLAAAIVLIVAGIFNGSARDVFGKVVKICTECVGLG